MSRPLVTIAVPTRNRSASLRESLKSICGQDYPSIDILISDNASDDDTERVGQELARADSRIRYVRHPSNIGLHGNHNFCMDEGRGDYLCIFHDHDARDLQIVSRYVSFLEEHPSVGVVCSDWELIDDAGGTIGSREHHVRTVTPGLEYIEQTIRSGRSSIGIPGAMIRRSALGAARFDPEAPIGFGDFAVWFQVAERADVGHLNERLWSWRQNSESHSARAIEAIADDYNRNIGGYCADHLRRWPEHAALVARWRRMVSTYLFWALAYEVGLHFRKRRAGPVPADRSLFEIMDYRLTPQQFQSALAQMKRYRTGATQYVAYAMASVLIQMRVTSPLVWATEHRTAVRNLLGLE